MPILYVDNSLLDVIVALYSPQRLLFEAFLIKESNAKRKFEKKNVVGLVASQMALTACVRGHFSSSWALKGHS